MLKVHSRFSPNDRYYIEFPRASNKIRAKDRLSKNIEAVLKPDIKYEDDTTQGKRKPSFRRPQGADQQDFIRDSSAMYLALGGGDEPCAASVTVFPTITEDEDEDDAPKVEEGWVHERMYGGAQVKHLIYPCDEGAMPGGTYETDEFDALVLLKNPQCIRNLEKLPHIHRWNKQSSSSLHLTVESPPRPRDVSLGFNSSSCATVFSKCRNCKRLSSNCPITGRILCSSDEPRMDELSN